MNSIHGMACCVVLVCVWRFGGAEEASGSDKLAGHSVKDMHSLNVLATTSMLHSLD
jgi:hypothetical protein